ncbi:MAG: tetratricopeptide repeat protein [Alphaproteobacteria bacterium]|nr:tetratricopeptide repeat protein [Alphaproteobacteria bacterium]
MYYEKKYAFSEPVLDEVKAFFAIAMKSVSITNDEAEEVFLCMWEEAFQGNEKVQERLFCLFSRSTFLETAKKRVLLLADETKYSLEVLMEMAITQEKSWAFYQKALMETDLGEKYTLLNQAMNNPNMEEALLIKIAAARNSLTRELGIQIPVGTNKNEIRNFITHYKKYKNGALLYDLYQMRKDSNKFFANECFKAASELGYHSACVDQENQCVSNGDLENAYKWSLKTVKTGNHFSMYNVGVYLTNNGQVKEGLKLLFKASELGFVEAMYAAGLLLYKFSDDFLDRKNVFSFIKTAAELGHIGAISSFANILMDKFADNDPNLEKAANLFLKVIKSNDAEQKDKAEAMHYYGRLIIKGFDGQNPNMRMGIEHILKAAKSGCVAAMNCYGGFLMGWVDNTEEKNIAAAYKWFLKAAKEGDAASMYNVGRMRWCGANGIKQDAKLAKDWLCRAVKVENAVYPDAMLLLSSCLINESFEENVSAEKKNELLNEAARLLCLLNDLNYFNDLVVSDETFVNKVDLNAMLIKSLCFESKNKIDLENIKIKNNINSIRSKYIPSIEEKVYAHLNLAKLYYNGHVDGEKNIKKSFELLLPVAKNNHPEAMNCIAKLFLEDVDGQGPNHKKALKWFRRAAENGHVDSMVRLGSLIILSLDFSQNDQSLSDALFWLQKANSLGNQDAAAYLEVCENSLKEIAESDIANEEVLRFVETNDVSKLNKNFHPLIMPSNIKDSKNDVNKDDHIEIAQLDDTLINVVFSDESINEVDVTETAANMSRSVECVNSNPKFKREQLRKIGLLKKNQESKENDVHFLKLSDRNQFIVNIILDKSIKNKNVDYTQLVNLFADPFFENQVSVIKSKSGCVITAKNYKTLDYVAASTHKKHNKTYDGLNPFFARDLLKTLALFGLTEG